MLRQLVEQDGTALMFISHDLALVSTVVERRDRDADGPHRRAGAPWTMSCAEPAHDYTRELLAAARLTHLEAAR